MPHLLYDSLSFIQKRRFKYTVDVEEILRKKYPEFADVVIETSNEIISALQGKDLASLAKHSPGLVGFDWPTYIRLSGIRVAKAMEKLCLFSFPEARILDYGSYFGNFSISLKKIGYEVHAIDSYASYGSVFDFVQELLSLYNVPVHAFDEPEYKLPVFSENFDVCLCFGVIEHIPHTPRPLMESLSRVLKSGGVLLLETPNLSYLYKIKALEAGDSIFSPIETQYHTAIPFQGHHREYTSCEIEWILNHEKYAILDLDLFLYSIYGMHELTSKHKSLFLKMLKEKQKREIMLFTARKQ
nr:class I SAM-dependent methyltransferase [Pseudodesulfovibrio sp.]